MVKRHCDCLGRYIISYFEVIQSTEYAFLREIITVSLDIFNDVVSNFCVACSFKSRSLLLGIFVVEVVA